MNNRLSWNPLFWLRAFVRPIDWPLLCIVFMLIAYAFVLLGSASPERLHAQMINTAVALVALWLTARLPCQRLMTLALPLYICGVLLLLAVMLFGESSKGAQRWLNIGVTRIQPSELMKIAMPLMLAWFFQQREGLLDWRGFVFAGVLLLVPVGLVVVQPDLGTGLLVLFGGLYVIFFAGLSWKLIVPAMLVMVIGIGSILVFGDALCEPGSDWFGIREHQKQRVCMLLDPTRDPLNKGFHIIQSTIAIGSGGMFGKGWTAGTQAHLAFLPERHTDFIFSVLAEEFGLVGAVFLLLVYTALLIRGFQIALRAQTLGFKLLAGAITMLFFTYAFVNMGMVSGILPVVGLPLPFISYGGTALVSFGIGIGILMSIKRGRGQGDSEGIHF